MKFFKRISLIVVAVLVLACSVPLSSMAVDPVSAATMANAFAQAITAYGASQGVSMTFDVTNTDGIGEGVHELWDQYAADMAQSNVTVSDYSNLAASVFPTLWKKTFDYVTVSLDAAAVGEIDGFWNWLLSGPAEMTKVDNQYYEWSIDLQTGSVLPISIFTVTDMSINGCPLNPLPIIGYYGNDWMQVDSASTVYAIVFPETASFYDAFLITLDNTEFYFTRTWNNQSPVTSHSQSPSMNSGYRYWNLSSFPQYYIPTNVKLTPYKNSMKLVDYIGNYADQSSLLVSSSDNLSVQPYVGDTAPKNVYIPDNTDVNYTPVAAEIPLDMLWDDTLYGDGTGTLSDAQSEAITQAADQAITDNPAKTLELADTVNPPSPSPSEVYIPFLPVTLPSFQFSLSGIWHYVTAWVASLGAWFSLVFTTWSYLPYAISVPVYATAVIVIVLGVYKRFFM